MRTSDTLLREVRRFAAAARPEDDPDRILVERFARSRDERAFAELVRRHGPMVLGVCRRVLRHTADADDAFQATFLILVRRAAALRDPDRLGAWLYGVAWRTANKLRASRRPGAPLPEEVPARESPWQTDWPVELDAAIARLPEKYRTPIVLCHLQGLSTAEAARRLGCPPATVTTRLFRAAQHPAPQVDRPRPGRARSPDRRVRPARADRPGRGRPRDGGRPLDLPRRGPIGRRRFPEPAHDQDPLGRHRRGRLPDRRGRPRLPGRRRGAGGRPDPAASPARGCRPATPGARSPGTGDGEDGQLPGDRPVRPDRPAGRRRRRAGPQGRGDRLAGP